MCQHVSAAYLCSLTESFISRYIMGQWWAIACEYRLTNRCIAGAMILLARYISFPSMKANGASISLGSALPQGGVSICHKHGLYVQIIMKQLSTAADVDRTIYYNERQWSVNNVWSCKYGNWIVICSLLGITDVLADFIGQETATRSLPHAENDLQWSVNDFWSCKYGNWIVTWLL